MCRFETKLFRHLVLQRLDVRRKELDHLSALGADHVVVVLVVVMVFVIGFVIAKTDFACKTGLGKQFERAIDRRVADGLVFAVDEQVKVVAREMLFGAQKDIEYQVTLSRTPQTRRLYMLVEYRLFDRKFVLFLAQNVSVSLEI